MQHMHLLVFCYRQGKNILYSHCFVNFQHQIWTTGCTCTTSKVTSDVFFHLNYLTYKIKVSKDCLRL